MTRVKIIKQDYMTVNGLVTIYGVIVDGKPYREFNSKDEVIRFMKLMGVRYGN